MRLRMRVDFHPGHMADVVSFSYNDTFDPCVWFIVGEEGIWDKSKYKDEYFKIAIERLNSTQAA